MTNVLSLIPRKCLGVNCVYSKPRPLAGWSCERCSYHFFFYSSKTIMPHKIAPLAMEKSPGPCKYSDLRGRTLRKERMYSDDILSSILLKVQYTLTFPFLSELRCYCCYCIFSTIYHHFLQLPIKQSRFHQPKVYT